MIPQASKILVKEINDIDKELKTQNSKFSDIVKEYREDTNGKAVNSLKSKTHKQLKKRFINCFREKSDEVFLDKTVISFSLFKLNKDEDIRDLLIKDHHLILGQFEAVLYYLKAHYENDSHVLEFIHSILNNEDVLFHHIIALCFKFFPHLPFDEKLYHKYTFEKHRHWLVNYFMIHWLFINNKKELILASNNENNHFIHRELNFYKYLSSSDNSFKRILSNRLLESKDALISLQGLDIILSKSIFFLGFKPTKEQNQFISYIFNKQPPDIISFTLSNSWGIDDSETIFNRNIWQDDNEYEELKTSFLLFVKSSDSDASKALLNLNTFNNLVFDKICGLFSIKKAASEYGINLNAQIINKILPVCNRYWLEINEKRNQKTEAHPYDKLGNIRVRITIKEFKDLYNKEKQTLQELCAFKAI